MSPRRRSCLLTKQDALQVDRGRLVASLLERLDHADVSRH
jgi:hypothetical protein